MQQRVRIPHRGRTSFVCQTTPHFGSTSRRVPTLFLHIIHDQEEKVNTFFDFISTEYGKIIAYSGYIPQG